MICDSPMVWTGLTWNIVDDDKLVLFQLTSAWTSPHNKSPGPRYTRNRSPRPNSSVWKYKFHNKLARINFQWMAVYLFVSIHTIRLYWIDCIPVYRPVPVSPLRKRWYMRNMLQYHHQDWNQYPLFHDLKTCENMFGTFFEKSCFKTLESWPQF